MSTIVSKQLAAGELSSMCARFGVLGFLCPPRALTSCSLTKRHQTKRLSEVINGMPIPAVQKDTVVKYVREPSKEEEKSFRADPQSIVADWAAEQKSLGITVSKEEYNDQVKMWEQNGEYL